MYVCIYVIYTHIFICTHLYLNIYIYIIIIIIITIIIIIIIIIVNLDINIRANRFSIHLNDKQDNFIFFVARKSYVAIFFQRYSTLHLRQKHCEEKELQANAINLGLLLKLWLIEHRTSGEQCCSFGKNTF